MIGKILRRLRRKAPRPPWANVDIPDELAWLPAFLDPEERQYYVWLTADKYEGWGAVVDLGCWLGGSTACFAEGLVRGGRTAKVHAFDHFKWVPHVMEHGSPENLPEGADFFPAFERVTRPWAASIVPHRQDLLTYRWDGGPIEILFVDAAKTWELTNAILRGFGDHLVPGRSRVVLQDFRFSLTHWLPLIFDSRPDVWQEIESVDGTTVTFVPLKPLHGPGGIHEDYTEEHFPLVSAEPLLAARIARENSDNAARMRRVLYRKSLLERTPGQLAELKAQILADRLAWRAGELENIEDVVWPASLAAWAAYNRGDVARARELAERSLAELGRLPPILFLLGRIHLHAGETAKAELYLEEVVSQWPALCPYARIDRALLRLRQGRYREAEQDSLTFLRSMKEGEWSDRSMIHGVEVLERIWEAENRADRGTGVLEELLREFGTSPVVWTSLARAEFELGSKAEALRHLDRALDLAPGHALAARLKAEWSTVQAS